MSISLSGPDRVEQTESAPQTNEAIELATKTKPEVSKQDRKSGESGEHKRAQASSVFAAGAQVMGLLPQIASWAIGLSCLAYLAGLREVSSYLGALGAPWAIALLSPTQLMQAGTPSATTIVLFGYVAFKFLLGGTSERRLQLAAGVGLAVGGLMSIAYFLDMSVALKLQLVQIATSILLVSGGLAVGELVSSLRETKEWGLRQISALDVIVLSALFGASHMLGLARAEADATRGASRLPVISLAGRDEQPWRLVLTNGDKLLLMSPAPAKEQRQFKVVSVTDVDAVIGK